VLSGRAVLTLVAGRQSTTGCVRCAMTANAAARRMALCCRQLAAGGLIAGRDGNLSSGSPRTGCS